MDNNLKDNENERLKEELLELKEETEHLRRQVKRAVNLRFHLMPSLFPLFPDLLNVDIYADQIGMARVGGDFFDIFRIDADHIGILVADIFEGGDTAALFMVAFKLYFSGELHMGFTPEKLMEVTNNRLARNNEDSLCLSAWYGLYEVSTGKLIAVNAGHEAPIILRNGKAETYEEDSVEYLMGVMEGISYESTVTYLQEGDALVIYTDGLTKATNPEGEGFTLDRIGEVIESEAGSSAENTVAQIQEKLFSFIESEPLIDDATIVCIKRTGGAGL